MYFPYEKAFSGYQYFMKIGFWIRRLGDLMTLLLILSAFLSVLWLGFENLIYIAPGILILTYLSVELRRFFKPKILVYRVPKAEIHMIISLIKEKTAWLTKQQHYHRGIFTYTNRDDQEIGVIGYFKEKNEYIIWVFGRIGFMKSIEEHLLRSAKLNHR